MRLISVLLPILLSGCSILTTLGDPVPSDRGEITVAGAGVMVPLENAFVAGTSAMPQLLASRARIARVTGQSAGERAGMADLCGPSAMRPDIVLLTRSPELIEIRRCEALGVDLSADLIALYNGDMPGAPVFRQLWIAYVPARLAQNRAAQRAVRALRYEFEGLIEGSIYELYFTARRN